jgi:hypothetical protein
MGVMLTMWVSFWGFGKVLGLVPGNQMMDASWSAAVLLEPEPEERPLGPVGPNWFGSVFCLRTYEWDRRPWDQQPVQKPNTHCSALILCIRVKTQNPLLCTHSLHTSFKGFREGRRMHTSFKGFIEGRRMHTSFKGFIEGRRMHTSFKGFIKRRRKRRKRRRQQQQLVLSSKDNKQAGCTFVVS